MHESQATLLCGRIVSDDGASRQRYVLIRDGIFEWISRSRPPQKLLEGVREIATGPQDWVFPGLIDLHTHASYNILPLWDSPRSPFDNRHVWRNDDSYRKEVSGVSRAISDWNVRKVFSELQAIAGGTTLLEEPRPLDAEDGEGVTVLCRNTGTASDLSLPDGTSIRSVVDFFRPDVDFRSSDPIKFHPRQWKPKKERRLDEYLHDRSNLHATLVHIAEGRSGFGSDRGVDPYSRAEFEALVAHPAMEDIEAVKKSRLTLVHGCGIDVYDPRHIEFLTEREISVVWSPASNMLLYGDTLDAGKLINEGVNVALGSDWSPSGSKHVWDEAKFARFFLNAINSDISDADVFKMVSANAARCLGLPNFGRIAEGAAADFFILRSPIESDNALEVFFSTSDRNVLATVVDGLPIYGDRDFISQFELPVQNLPEREGSAVVNKVVHLPESVGLNNFAGDLDELEDRLKDEFDPPVRRSNLLSESDTPYRRRFHKLRGRVERFGWNVRQWKKRGPSLTPGQLPLSPAVAHVASGQRSLASSEHANLGDFAASIGTTFFPMWIRLGQPHGLTACLCAIAPEDAPEACPDVVRLEFFSSSKPQENTAAPSLGGRARELLSNLILEDDPVPPKAFRETVEPQATYYLIDRETDWYAGGARISFFARSNDVPTGDYTTHVASFLQSLAGEGDAQRDGLLATVGSDYLILWEHTPMKEMFDSISLTVPRGQMVLVGQSIATPLDFKASLSEPWEGTKLTPGAFVQARFERRDLYPW